MGEAKPTADEQLRLAREQYESADDFTVAVEEEFAILDPETLSLTNRFEELKAAAQGTELEDHLVGELIASEVEVRTGRCDTFAEAAARIPERRAQLGALAEKLGVILGATGTHPWSPWQEQRIIDTPHYRLRDELLRYVVWRNNSFGLHVHVAINGLDRAVQVSDGLRAYLPELLALLGQLAVRREREHRSPLGADPDLHALLPALWHPRRLRRLGDVREIRAVSLRHRLDPRSTEMWWSVRPHLSFPTVEMRIADAQPLQEEAISLAALIIRADCAYRPRDRRGRARFSCRPTASSRKTSGARSGGGSQAS